MTEIVGTKEVVMQVQFSVPAEFSAAELPMFLEFLKAGISFSLAVTPMVKGSSMFVRDLTPKIDIAR